MSGSLGKLKPFIVVNKTAQLYGTNGYPVGGTNPPPSGTVAPPLAPGETLAAGGPLPGTNCINLLTLRDYYKIPYPPTTPLASPPVIGIVSFGGGLYGQPVSSGKYSGFWRCSDISGSNGAPIQILVSPINGAINAPNADDGGATLENTVDVATVSAFYGMVNLGNGAPVYTPPVIILYIAPSDDISEMHKTFYTVLNNPVVCNGQSYTPSIVCCSWGAPEVSWTQKNPFPNPEEQLDDDPNPAGIAEMNEINDLLADATKRGINICVASGDIPLPSSGLPEYQEQSSLGPSTIMFPASSPYVTCVGGSSVFFPLGPSQNFANAGEFAWARADGGISKAFPLPDYQKNVPGAALISADAFLLSSQNTSLLLETALGEANVVDDNSNFDLVYSSVDSSGTLQNISLAAAKKAEVLLNSQVAYNTALATFNSAVIGDVSRIQLQLAVNTASTALAAAISANKTAQEAVALAQDAVVKASPLDALLNEAAWASGIQYRGPSTVNAAAKDVSLVVANKAVAQGASSVIAPTLVSDLKSDLATLVEDTTAVSNQLVVPYDSFPVAPGSNLVTIYTGMSNTYPAYSKIEDVKADIETLQVDVSMDSSNNTYTNAVYNQSTAVDITPNDYSEVVAQATASARLAIRFNDNVTALLLAKTAWQTALDNVNYASGNLASVNAQVPTATDQQFTVARDAYSAAVQQLTDASVLLANVEFAALKKANDGANVSSLLVTAADASGFKVHFQTGDASGVYQRGFKDASGANAQMETAQLDMALYVLGSLEGLCGVATATAAEAKQRYDQWVIAKDASNNNTPTGVTAKIAASDKCLAAANRSVDAMKALKAVFDNVQLNAAMGGDWPTGGIDASGSVAIAAALTASEAVVTQIYNSLLVTNSDASTPPNISYLNAAYNPSTGAVALAVNAVTNAYENYLDGSPYSYFTSYMNALAADTTTALSTVLTAEANLLYLVSNWAGLSSADANYAAAVSAEHSIYDEFKAFNDALTNAYNVSVVAKNLAKLANVRLASGSIPQATMNATLFNAQNATYKLVAASLQVNALITSYSEITPSLVDAAVRSQIANDTAADDSNTATASQTIPPVTPQMVEKLQELVLKAKIQAQLVSEANPTSTVFTSILANWNAAVIAGSNVLTAMTGTDEGSGNSFSQILVIFANAIDTAANDGDYYMPDLPEDSSLTIAAISAYNFSLNYFTNATNGANLQYLMTAANNAISLAENAAAAAKSSETNANRANALALWQSARAKISALVGTSGYFNPASLVLPYDLHTTVALAYQQTTGRGVTGSVRGTIATDVLTITGVANMITGTLDSSGTTVTGIVGPIAVGSTISFPGGYSATISAQLTNSITPDNSTTKGACGTYSLIVVSGSAPSGLNTFTTNLPTNITPSEINDSEDSVSFDAYTKSVNAYNSFILAYNSYNTNFIQRLQDNVSAANASAATAKTAIALALAAAKRVQVATKFLAEKSSTMATASNPPSIHDQAAVSAAEASYAAADNVNMYRCIPDVAMHANADDLPIIYRLNGGNVFVGGTSVAAAMFAGFLAVTQSHSPINYFMNPVLYNNFTYPSPLFYDISGTSELLNSSLVTSRYNWVVDPELDYQNTALGNIHGSYNTRVGLGSIRGDGLSAFLGTPQLVSNMISTSYPVPEELNGFFYVPVPSGFNYINTITVRPGTTQDIYVYISDSRVAYNTNVEWSSSSPYNATVSQTLETIQAVYDSNGDLLEGVIAYRARVTGVVPVDPLSPFPVITIKSTDGSNVFTTARVNVLPGVQVTGVSISSLGETTNPSNTILSLGSTLQLIATVTPVAATNKAVYWWSSNPSVVNVDVNGFLTPLSSGQATIRVTTVNNNISASISVYVPTPITGISVMPSMVTLNPNLLVYPLKNTQLLKALLTPNNVDYKYLKWSIVSSQPLSLPTGTTDSTGNSLIYNGSNDASGVIVATIPTPDGKVLKRDSNGNITDNTQATVTALTNGRIIIRVSTDAADTVYGTYSADVTVNVVTPVTNVTLEQMNMVIALNPSVKASTGPLGVYADASGLNPLVSTFDAVNPSVNVQYSASDPDMTISWLNALLPDRDLPQSYDVKATLFPAYPSNMNLVWTSSNPKVAIISNNTPPVLNTNGSDPNNGLFQVTEKITPLSNGSTVISVATADGNKVASVNVTVTTPVTSIVLSPMPVTLNPGKQYALQATILPTTATITDLIWESTNVAVARVDQYGVVTAVSTGSCGISVTTADGDYTAMATINVVTPLVGVSLVLNTPMPIRIGDLVQILVVMTPTTASDQAFTWSVTNGINGNIFTNGPPQNGNIVYLDAAQSGSSVFTVTTHDGNKQASLALTVSPY